MRIIVIGAYGFTGRLICKELALAGIRFALSGRNASALETLRAHYPQDMESYCFDIRKQDDVAQILSSFDLIVNCAGPFTEESSTLLEELAKSGKIYLDISGELAFVRHSWEQYHNIASNSGALIIHACAFESLVTELLMNLLNKQLAAVQSVGTYYWFSSKKVSPGTRLTMKLAKYRSMLKIQAGEWQAIHTQNDQLPVHLSDMEIDLIASPYPLPEVAFSKWNFDAQLAESFLLLPKEEAKMMGLGIKEDVSPLALLDKLRRFKTTGPTQVELEAQRGIVAVLMTDINGLEKQVVADCQNMYQTTAVAIRLAINYLVKSEERLAGVISPAHLFMENEVPTLHALNVEVNKRNQLTFG